MAKTDNLNQVDSNHLENALGKFGHGAGLVESDSLRHTNSKYIEFFANWSSRR